MLRHTPNYERSYSGVDNPNEKSCRLETGFPKNSVQCVNAFLYRIVPCSFVILGHFDPPEPGRTSTGPCNVNKLIGFLAVTPQGSQAWTYKYTEPLLLAGETIACNMDSGAHTHALDMVWVYVSRFAW